MSLCLAAHAADAQVTPGEQQSAAQTATITGTVLQNAASPVAGADVRLIGPALLNTKSDAHGYFTFVGVTFGTYRIVASSKTGTASRDDIVVHGDLTVTVLYAAAAPTAPSVIGRVSTRSSGVRINTTAASIFSVDPTDYAFAGNASWRHVLDEIPGVAVGGSLKGGLNANSINSIPGAPFEPISVSINGALPYETATTLDGMPLANTSFANTAQGGVDLSFLPLATFETADVVRGPGADAPSIVNSIGGSFVLHAPGRVLRNQSQLSVSSDPFGGVIANAKVALRTGKLSATVVYSLNDSPGPLGSRSAIAGSTPTIATINGQPLSKGGFIDTITNTHYKGCTCGFENSLLVSGMNIDTSWKQHGGSIGLAYDLTPSVTAQVFYTGSSSKMALEDFLSPVNFIPGSGYAGSVSPGAHQFYVGNGYIPAVQSSSLFEEKLTAYVGKGVVRISALQNNSFEQSVQSSILPNGTYTLYGTGYFKSAPTVPVNFNGTSANLTFPPLTDTYTTWVNSRDLLFSYAVQVGARSTVGLSYGTSYYNFPHTIDEIYNGTDLSTAGPPSVAELTREIRIHAGTQISDKLSADASMYIANGSYHVQNPNSPTGFVNSNFPYSAPRAGLTWKATPDVVIRASAGGGFALPPISYLTAGDRFSKVGTYYYESRANLNLTPERSFGFDLGTDIRIRPNTILSADVYRTNLFGQFFNSVELSGTHLGLPNYVSQYRNLSHSRYEGLNLDVRHDVAAGIFWRGALGLTRAYVVSVPSGFYDSVLSGPNSVNTYIVPGANFNGQFQSAVPYASAAARIGYRWSTSKYFDVSPNYYGNGNTYFVPAFLELDAHAGYPLTKSLTLQATFRNVTGIHGSSYQLTTPSLGAPTISGLPYPLYALPYGPRALIVTASLKR